MKACNFISLWNKCANFEPGFGSKSGIGSGSAFVKKAEYGSVYNECGSEALVPQVIGTDEYRYRVSVHKYLAEP
jgi:hypothetical protein